MTVPGIILHVPHKPRPRSRGTYGLNSCSEDDDSACELRLMTDWHTDELFALPPDEAVTVRFPVSRLVVDPERFEDPEAERMEAVGMGAVYTKTSQGLSSCDEAGLFSLIFLTKQSGARRRERR